MQSHDDLSDDSLCNSLRGSRRNPGERHRKDWTYLKSTFKMLLEICNPFRLSLPFARDGSSGLDEEEVDSAV